MVTLGPLLMRWSERLQILSSPQIPALASTLLARRAIGRHQCVAARQPEVASRPSETPTMRHVAEPFVRSEEDSLVGSTVSSSSVSTATSSCYLRSLGNDSVGRDDRETFAITPATAAAAVSRDREAFDHAGL